MTITDKRFSELRGLQRELQLIQAAEDTRLKALESALQTEDRLAKALREALADPNATLLAVRDIERQLDNCRRDIANFRDGEDHGVRATAVALEAEIEKCLKATLGKPVEVKK